MASSAEVQKMSARKVKELLATPGWLEVIEPELIGESNRLMAALVSANDAGLIREIQLELRGIQKVLDKIKFYASIKT